MIEIKLISIRKFEEEEEEKFLLFNNSLTESHL